MKGLLLAALAAVLAAERPEQAARPERGWKAEETVHFTLRRQAPGASLAQQTLLERIHAAHQRELRLLAPWLEASRTEVYVYRDLDAYRGGSFEPPAWSEGLFSTEGGGVLALPEPLDETAAAHELAHLHLHAYFSKGGARPPAWLDEGLATLLQEGALGLPDPTDKGPVLPRPAPLVELLGSRPERDDPSARVSAWYRQAHSLVRFLKREHSETRFAELCRRLREGAGAEAALREAYGFEDLAALERAWGRWRPRKARGEPVGLEAR